MRKYRLAALIVAAVLLTTANSYAKTGFFIGAQFGFSAQKPSLSNVSFDTNTSFLFGVRAGLKILAVAVEANYFQAAHNLEPKQLATLSWGAREIDYNYLGVNVKYFFPLLMIQPYLTAGYGFYTASVQNIDKDTDRGFNFGLGIELHLGSKLSLLAEGKYHHVTLDIDNLDFGIGDFTLAGGLNIYF